MIERFNFLNENKISFSVFENSADDIVDQFFDGSKKGISWCDNNKKIEVWSKEVNVSGYPSVDLNYVIAIYLGDKGEYRPPCNAVIYNADGSIHKKLCVPPLISKAAKERGWYRRTPDETIGFTQVNWQKDSSGNLVVAVDIKERGYGPFREVRVLNPKTGEFGECLHGAIEYK